MGLLRKSFYGEALYGEILNYNLNLPDRQNWIRCKHIYSDEGKPRENLSENRFVFQKFAVRKFAMLNICRNRQSYLFQRSLQRQS